MNSKKSRESSPEIPTDSPIHSARRRAKVLEGSSSPASQTGNNFVLRRSVLDTTALVNTSGHSFSAIVPSTQLNLQYSLGEIREFSMAAEVQDRVLHLLENPRSILAHIRGITPEDKFRLQEVLLYFILGKIKALAFIGPTGAGKSTLLEAVKRLVYSVADPIFSAFGEKTIHVTPVYYDVIKREVSTLTQKPTAQFGPEESELLDAAMTSRVLSIVGSDPYVEDTRKLSHRVLVETPAYKDRKRDFSRGFGSIVELSKALGDSFGIISVGQHPAITEIAKISRFIALQKDPISFIKMFIALGFQPVFQTNRRYAQRLQESLQLSGSPDTVQEIMTDLFSYLRVEFRGRWQEIKKIKLPEEFCDLSPGVANDIRRLVFYMQTVLAPQVHVSTENVLSFLNVPAGDILEREA